MTELHIIAEGFVALVARATLVLCSALAVAWFLRRDSARTLHLLWTTTFAVMLVLPGLSLLTPSWSLPILPAQSTATERGPPVNPMTERPPENAVTEQRPSANTVTEHGPPEDPTNEPRTAAGTPTIGMPAASNGSTPGRTARSFALTGGSIRLTPTLGVFLIWVLGCGAGLISLATAVLRFRRLVREANPICNPDWARSVKMLRHRLRVPTDVRILANAQVATPMTGGPSRPVILLPASAESWTAERRETVLAHELVHVRRWDALWRLVGGAVVALYWFHPLVWLASRRAAAAGERSCDEEVLTLGLRPSVYARHLVSLASEITPGPRALSLSFVQHSSLENRIMSILALRRTRFSRNRAGCALMAVGVVGIVAACVTPVPMEPVAIPASPSETVLLNEIPAGTSAAPSETVFPHEIPAGTSASPPESVLPDEPQTGASRAPAPALARSADKMPAELPAMTSELPATTAVPPSPPGLLPVQLPVPEALGLQESGCAPTSFTGIMRDSEATTMQVSVDGVSLCMRTRGDVELTEDRTAVASMDPGSWLLLQSRAERLHQMRVTSVPGGLEYEWSVDGRSQPLDDEAHNWRKLVLTVLGRTQEAWEVRGRESSMRREIGSHQRHVASLEREIGSRERHVASLEREIGAHERHVASLGRQIGSHERHVASLDREIGSHQRNVASLERDISSHERHVASLERKISAHERHVSNLEREISSQERKIAGLRRDMVQIMETALGEWTRALDLEQLDLRGLELIAQALLQEPAGVQLDALDDDVRQLVQNALRLEEETRNEVAQYLADLQAEAARAQEEIRSARQAIDEYDLDRRVGDVRREIERYDLGGRIRDVEAEIERYDLAGKIRDVEAEVERYDLGGKIREIGAEIERYDLDGKIREIEAEIERYDLDGKIREIEAEIERYDLNGKVRAIETQIEEWDADRRVEEIERSLEEDVASLRRLLRAAE